MHRGFTGGKTRKQPKLRVVKEEKMATEKEAEERGRQRLGSGTRRRADHERRCLNEKGPRKSEGQISGTDASEHPE
jgi:hypothetical protein